MTKTWTSISAAAVMALLAGLKAAAQTNANAGMPTNDVGFSQLSDARGLDNPYFRWNAKVVYPPGKASAEEEQEHDYAAFAYGRPWNFDQGGLDGISTNKNLADFKVTDGKLCFTTGKDSFFYWGSHLKGDGFKKIKIGDNWRQPDFPGNWQVKIRLKQSLPETTWRVFAVRDGVISPAGAVVESKLAVKGTDWQTVVFPMDSDRRNTRREPELRRSLAIQCEQAGNRVEIDWVKAVSPAADTYYRSTLILAKPVKKAALCYKAGSLYVNGEKIEQDPGLAGCNYIRAEGGFFQQGTNVLAVKTRGHLFALEGIVHFADGTFQRFFSDENWKCSWQYAEDWMKPAFDESSWKKVKTGNNVAVSEICLHPDHPSGGYSGNVFTPPYFGPIELVSGAHTVSGDPHIFKLEDGIAITVKLPCRPGADYTAHYLLTDAINGGETARGQLSGTRQGEEFTYPLANRPARPGVYNLRIEARENGQILDTRFFECAVAGKLPMPEYTLDEIDRHIEKVLLDKIECGNPKDPHEMLEGKTMTVTPGSSKVLAKDGVLWREPGLYPQWFSYKFDVKNPWKPLLIEVRYLDDRAARLTISLDEPTRKVYKNLGNTRRCRNAMTVVTGGPYKPLTGKIQTAQLLYWPQYEYATVSLFSHSMTADLKSPAVVDVSIYELKDIPAVKAPNESGRLFGDHRERGTLTVGSLYAGPMGDAFAYDHGGGRLYHHYGYYRDWFITIANQIKFLRFTGQNLIVAGFLMYDNNNTFTYSSKVLGNGQFADQHKLWLEMFGANDLYLLAGFEIFGCMTVQRHRDATQYTDEEVAAGAPAMCQIDKDGRQVWGGGCGNFAIRPSPSHPQYQQWLSDAFGELMSKYGRYKAFAGVHVASGFFSPTWFYDYKNPYLSSALDVDYGDLTMKAFDKYLGKNVPVDHADPDRFRKRYDWIMANAKEEFIDFRCAELAKLHKVIGKEVGKYPGKKYYLTYSEAAPVYEACFKGMKIRDAYRLLGMDPKYYQDDPVIVLGKEMVTETFQPRDGIRHEGQLTDDYNRFWDGAQTAAFIRNCFYEPGLGYPEGTKWYWGMFRATLLGTAQFDAHRYFNRYYTARLLKSTPGTIIHLLQDMNLVMGEMDSVRRFGVTFRSIPLGDYHNLTGNGLDRNIVVRETDSGATHAFYVVNPGWWDVEVELNLSKDAAILDLVSNRESQGAELKFKLDSFGVKVFNVKTAGVKLTGADTKISAEGVKFITDRLETVTRAFAQLTPESFIPLDVNITFEQAQEKMNIAREALAGKNYTRVMEVLETVAFLRIFNMAETLLTKKAEAPRHEYRVDCGSSKPFTDSKGRVWLADQQYTYGANLYGSDGLNFADQRQTRGKFEIKGTPDQELYHTERYDFDKYAFRVPNGDYQVTLHFAQTWQSKPTKIDLDIEGQRVLTDFDMMQNGGFDTAIVKTFNNIKVTDGELDLRMFGSGRKVMAIEVEKVD